MQKNVCYHTAIYLRLSRDDEDIDGSAKRESDSISSQRELARSFVREQPDMELFDIYIDDGYSGANFDRPDFKWKCKLCRCKRFIQIWTRLY